ncbi:MAG: S9 family peptidase, partial [Flavobacteriaceae bacterium]|nr:S9 family peptidase [Flavobacteriaceae bacterium]
MHHFRILAAMLFFVSLFSPAQQKQITLENIWNGTFRTERMDVLHSMNNGKQYSVLNFERNSRTSSVDVYDYETLSKNKTLVNSKDLGDMQYFLDYDFSDDESKLLLASDIESIYRRSTLGTYYVYDINSGELSKVADYKIQEPTFSPDGSKIAYGYENNLYVKDLASGSLVQITSDGKKNEIINGITDWVYEEEFSFVRAFDWNADGSKIAFIRFDETEVPEFSMDVYGQQLYPDQLVFKYPKAGEKNAEVSLFIYDLESNSTSEVKVGKSYSDFYIPRLQWTNDADILSAQYMNRHQNELDLWMINASNMSSDLALAETDEAYIDVTFNLTFLDDNSFIWTSE